MDITPLFNEALSKHGAPIIPIGRKPPPPVEEFLKEAYRIESHISSLTKYLLSIRQSYLSTSRAPPPPYLSSRLRSSSSIHGRPSSPLSPSSSASPPADRRYLTDAQRDEIDAEAKSTIRQSIQVIQNLEAVEKIRIETERIQYKRKKRKGMLGWRVILLDDDDDGEGGDGKKDVEDEGMRTVRLHREGVVWLLKNRLERASEIQREQQETRVLRQVERSKSMLYKATSAGAVGGGGGVGGGGAGGEGSSKSRPTSSAGSGAGMAWPGAAASSGSAVNLPPEEQEDIEKLLSPQQLQLFEKENQDLMNHYETTLDQVRTAERSLIEISELQTQLAANLTTQQAFLDQLVADSIATHENVEKGNKELKEAAQRSTWASSVFYGAVAFSFVTILYDFIL